MYNRKPRQADRYMKTSSRQHARIMFPNVIRRRRPFVLQGLRTGYVTERAELYKQRFTVDDAVKSPNNCHCESR